MLDPHALTHTQLAEIVADVQAILAGITHAARRSPECGDYWNPAKEWDSETVVPMRFLVNSAFYR
jgi:hypothetical protein